MTGPDRRDFLDVRIRKEDTTMKDDLLSITELARLRKVTSETLRHYDRIGLLKPTWVDPETNYRYYSIRQYERLGTIRELRDLGLSIEEIQDYFDDRNLDKSLEILKRQQQRLQEEFHRRLLLSKILSRKLHFIKETAQALPSLNNPFQCRLAQRHIITFDEPAGGPREHAFAFTKLEQHLTGVAPVLASDSIGVYGDECLLHPSAGYIPCVPMVFVEDPGAIESGQIRKIPSGEYVCMFYRGSGLEEYNPAFEEINTYMKACDLHPCGPIFQVYKIDKTVTDRPDETLLEIQVPVQLND